MSDRSYVQLHVLDCPEDQQAALAAAATALGLAPEFGAAAGTAFTVEEYHMCEVGEEFAPALIAAAPQARWRVWQDPKYDVAGSLAAYDGVGGLFTADCDAQGEPYLTATQVHGIIVEAVAGGQNPIAALRTAVGLDHATAAIWRAAR